MELLLQIRDFFSSLFWKRGEAEGGSLWKSINFTVATLLLTRRLWITLLRTGQIFYRWYPQIQFHNVGEWNHRRLYYSPKCQHLITTEYALLQQQKTRCALVPLCPPTQSKQVKQASPHHRSGSSPRPKQESHRTQGNARTPSFALARSFLVHPIDPQNRLHRPTSRPEASCQVRRMVCLRASSFSSCTRVCV